MISHRLICQNYWVWCKPGNWGHSFLGSINHSWILKTLYTGSWVDILIGWAWFWWLLLHYYILKVRLEVLPLSLTIHCTSTLHRKHSNRGSTLLPVVLHHLLFISVFICPHGSVSDQYRPYTYLSAGHRPTYMLVAIFSIYRRDSLYVSVLILGRLYMGCCSRSIYGRVF